MMKYGIIDVSALTYSANYVMPNLYSNNQATGILYGFTRYLLSLQQKFKFDNIIFAFDSRNSKRREIYPEYKGGRKNIDISKLVYSQMKILKNEILPQIGFKNLFESDGLEADDIIGSLCQTKNPEDEYIIISRDQDLYQLLNKDISQYDYISKKMMTIETFQDKYSINPIQWQQVKSIGGCKSDMVPGIRGIGEKSICKYLNNNLKKSSTFYQKIESDEGKRIAKFNEKLVNLPFEGTPKFKIVEDQISFESLTKFFVEYNFVSQLTNRSLDMWRENFRWIDVKKSKMTLDDFF